MFPPSVPTDVPFLFKELLAHVATAAVERLPSRIFMRNVVDPYLKRFDLFRRDRIEGRFSELWVPDVHPHYFYRGDDDHELHNHPWEFAFAIILTNGYVEQRRVFGPRGEITIREREYPPLSVNVIRANDFHKVQLLDPTRGCWTLFFAWRRMQDWGFWHPDTGEFVLADEHRDRQTRRDPGLTHAIHGYEG